MKRLLAGCALSIVLVHGALRAEAALVDARQALHTKPRVGDATERSASREQARIEPHLLFDTESAKARGRDLVAPAIRFFVTGADDVACAHARARAHGSETDAAVADGPVLEMPAPPSSLALVLSGLLSLGAYQSLRCLKRLNWHVAVPDWYHTGGPAQVGATTPIDIDFDQSALRACLFEAPTDWAPRVASCRQARAVFRPQFIPLPAPPRGPPLRFFAG